MKLIDIHSHILPAVDDGSKNIATSIKLLEMMKEQGITDVVATPHFIASEQSLEEHISNINAAKAELEAAVCGMELPNIYLGSEVYYFKGIGRSDGIRKLSLNGSQYLLLELPMYEISEKIAEDVRNISYNLGLTPILAHIERYHREKGFKKVLKLIESGCCYAQINTSSLFIPPLKRTVRKLIKKGYVSFIATDTHSPDHRPPLMKEALRALETDFGREYKREMLMNLDSVCREITDEKAEMKFEF